MKIQRYVKPYLSACLLLFAAGVSAQDLAGNFIRSGISDANRLAEAYLSTTIKGMGQGLNDGWHNTAKPLGVLGLDLRFSVGFGFVPEADRTYNFYGIGLNTDHSKPYLVLPAGTNPNQPTVYGEHSSNPPEAQVRVSYAGFDTLLTTFTMPTGSGYHISPSIPMIQGSVGIPFNTEVNVRFFPETKFLENYRIGLFGIGFKHDLVQWIPAYRDLALSSKRPFDWSVYASYTRLMASYGDGPLLEVDPNAYNPDPSIRYDNQRIEFTGNSWSIGTIISKELGLHVLNITPFAGVNYAWSGVSLKFAGDYPLVVPNDEFSPFHPQVSKIQRVSDPVSFESTLSNVRLNAGVRIKLALVTLSAEYNLGKYNTMSIGLGLNLQSIKPFSI